MNTYNFYSNNEIDNAKKNKRIPELAFSLKCDNISMYINKLELKTNYKIIKGYKDE